MEDKSKKTNISFPKKVWYSITKFEQYPTMATEGISRAIRYLIILTAIVAVFSVVGSILKVNKQIWKVSEYIEQNVPDFTFEDGKVSMNLEEPIILTETGYNAIEKVVIDPSAENSEDKEKEKNDEIVPGVTIFFFKDQIVLNNKIDDDNIQTQEYTYNEFITNYTKEEITNFNKSELIDYMRSSRMNNFYEKYSITIFTGLFLTGIIYAFLDTLRVALFGWITAVIAKIKMKFSAVYTMSIYAFTFPMLLEIVYIVINYFTDFTIKYFQVAYTTIAYIYLAAAIFILKDDFIKKMQEVMKIKQEQKNVREEIKRQEEKKEEPKEDKEQKKKEDKEDDESDGDEPQGSEA